jgi:hypothetical protein
VRIAYFFPFLDQAHRHAGHRRLERDARVEAGQRAAADGRHRGRPVGLEDLRHDADRVRELLEGRQHRLDGALGEHAVPDLATARATHRLGLARGERREVVVQHERLRRLLGVVDVVHTLDVIGGAERRDDERLRLAAREQRRAVGAREQRGVDRDVAHDVRLAAVDAEAGVEHLRAQRVVLDVADDHPDEAVMRRDRGPRPSPP